MLNEFPSEDYELIKIPLCNYLFFVYLESEKISDEVNKHKSKAIFIV